MELIAHRKNTRALLEATPFKYGVEVDIRSYGQTLYIQHDAFVVGESFDSWLEAYKHGTLILNVKEEGLEDILREKMRQKRIENFFFLDQSFPFLIKTAKIGEIRCAVRVSEFESVSTALTLKNKIQWVWVDCFTHFSLSTAEARELTSAGFKLCLVSPELQGRDANLEIPALRRLLLERRITAAAVCTKYPELWEAEMRS